jgi:hypothetical protein
LCPGFGDECLGFAFLQYDADIAVGVIEIAEVHAFCRTYGHAGWLHSLSYAVYAESAFVNISLRMGIACIIGA